MILLFWGVYYRPSRDAPPLGLIAPYVDPGETTITKKRKKFLGPVLFLFPDGYLGKWCASP